MELEENHIDDLIGKVLAGEATPAEQTEVDAWVRESESNRKYFEQFKTIFVKAAATNIQLQFDTDAAWQKVKQRLQKEAKVVSMTPTEPGFKFQANPYWLRIAAGILFAIGFSYLAYLWMAPPVQTLAIVSDKTAVHDTLPDGSKTFLNKKSEITFEYNPRQKTRKVKLKGEAFFEVRHEEEKPFIIETDEVLIKDLGTAFNVKAYPESNTVEVTVESGEVQIYTIRNTGLDLHAGEKGIYDKTLREFLKIVKIDTNVYSYKTKVFSFNNTDLGSVVDKINEVYNAKIRLSNEMLRNCRLTVNFDDDELETVIEVLGETMNLKVVRSGEVIVLEGKGCN